MSRSMVIFINNDEQCALQDYKDSLLLS